MPAGRLPCPCRSSLSASRRANPPDKGRYLTSAARNHECYTVPTTYEMIFAGPPAIHVVYRRKDNGRLVGQQYRQFIRLPDTVHPCGPRGSKQVLQTPLQVGAFGRTR